MTGLILISCFAAEPLAPTPVERASYEEGLNHYREGNFADAEKIFQPLTISSTRVASLAHFVLGNINVLRAVGPKTNSVSANRLLGNAIVAYRAVLDSPPAVELNLSNVRHNIELAKRLAYALRKSSDTNRESSTAGVDRKATRSKQSDSASKSTPPRQQDERQSTYATKKTSEDRGKVHDPLPGEEFTETPPLTASEAESRLRAAVVRIDAMNRRRLNNARSRRPVVPGDY